MTSGEQLSDVNFNLYVYNFFPTYTVTVSVNPNFTNAGISSYTYHINQNSEDVF